MIKNIKLAEITMYKVTICKHFDQCLKYCPYAFPYFYFVNIFFELSLLNGQQNVEGIVVIELLFFAQ